VHGLSNDPYPVCRLGNDPYQAQILGISYQAQILGEDPLPSAKTWQQ